jgi:hypothetical protein
MNEQEQRALIIQATAQAVREARRKGKTAAQKNELEAKAIAAGRAGYGPTAERDGFEEAVYWQLAARRAA